MAGKELGILPHTIRTASLEVRSDWDENLIPVIGSAGYLKIQDYVPFTELFVSSTSQDLA